MTELNFKLEVVDGWPPIGFESVPCSLIEGGFRIESPPLFVKGLSCGDLITAQLDADGIVQSWGFLKQSNRTTIWLLRTLGPYDLRPALRCLRGLGCHTVQLENLGCYSVDVPGECAFEKVDECLANIDNSFIAIAYPSFRHPEPESPGNGV